MAAQPDTEHPGSQHTGSEHSDYPAERPEQWGFHGEFGRWARVAGWVTVIILLLMLTTTHYNLAGAFALIATAALLVVALLWDRNRRRTSWR